MSAPTVQDVIALALRQGYRWEAQAPGRLPLLTNCPPQQHWCLHCGTWQPEPEYNPQTGACRPCTNHRQRGIRKTNRRYRENR